MSYLFNLRILFFRIENGSCLSILLQITQLHLINTDIHLFPKYTNIKKEDKCVSDNLELISVST